MMNHKNGEAMVWCMALLLDHWILEVMLESNKEGRIRIPNIINMPMSFHTQPKNIHLHWNRRYFSIVPLFQFILPARVLHLEIESCM